MSNVSMIRGYAVKGERPIDDDEIDDLCENFNYKKHKVWQRFYDYDGYSYFVYLIEYEYEFLDDINASVNISEILAVSRSFHEYIDKEYIDVDKEYINVDVDIHSFVKVWYNGSDMGSIIEDKT